eukprot:m.459837 g.459837  ORF g.459837 m.459837 type:complete len:459 (-) comp21843_c0_seq1:95-1471(-)
MEGDREERYRKADNSVRSTGGAIKVKNAKGEVVMEKVKVTRYFARQPEWAKGGDSDDTSDEDDAVTSIARGKAKGKAKASAGAPTVGDALDRRLKRLEELQSATSAGPRLRERHVEAVVVEEGESDEEVARPTRGGARAAVVAAVVEEAVEEEEEENDAEIERRRARMLARARAQAAATEELAIEDDDGPGAAAGDDEESESESEYETDSEDDMPAAMPVFVTKAQRETIREREEKEAAELARQAELENKLKQRQAESRDLVAKTMQEELNAEHRLAEHEIDDKDDEYNAEEEFAAWKVRELKRIKRDQDKRAAEEAEKAEIERLRGMTEEERLKALESREKVITNKQAKGKQGFMQKYYHRGAFFMDEDEELYKRDTSAPTGDDHFDKSVLPKPLQVRKDQFGKIGRTKYTHLVDQDTSSKDSAWSQKTPVAERMEKKRGGTANIFERPSGKRRKDG